MRLPGLIGLLCILSTLCRGDEPVLIQTPEEAKASPYDNLRIGVPIFTDFVVDREGFSIGYSRQYRQPLWVQYRLEAREVAADAGTGVVSGQTIRFHKDPVVPGAPSPDDYTHSGYDRGHMAPAGDMQWSAAALAASYAMTNVCPQHPHCNRRTLRRLEELIRSWARNEKELYVISGPVFRENPITIGNGTIPVPEAFYKIVYDVTPPQKMIAFLIPNRETKQPLCALMVTVREVEKVTGYDFFNFLPEPTQKRLELIVSTNDWIWIVEK